MIAPDLFRYLVGSGSLLRVSLTIVRRIRIIREQKNRVLDGVADRFDIPSVTVQRERNDHVIGVRGMVAVRHTAALTADRGDLCHLRKRLAADLSGICLEHKRIPFSEKGGRHNRYHRHGSQASRCRRDPFGARASGSLCVCVCVFYSLH